MLPDHETAKLLIDRVADLEVTVKWLVKELGGLSERLHQATQVEEIIRRAHKGS